MLRLTDISLRLTFLFMNHRYHYTNCYNVTFKDKVTLTLHKEKPADSGLVMLYFVITDPVMRGLKSNIKI